MRLSSSFGLVDWRHVGIVYILLIFIGTGGGVEGGVGMHIVIGEGDHCVVSARWAFREVSVTDDRNRACTHSAKAKPEG